MDATTLKIAISSFFHDIGKFAGKESVEITNDYFDRHAGLYLPFKDGYYSHTHALNTAAFIEQMAEWLPPEFNMPGWGEGDSFINLAAGHHNPDTAMQWVIAIADRISSGWDRDSFDREYEKGTAWKDYQKTRLLPLFEQLMKEGEQEHSKDQYNYAYPLGETSPENIFPALKEETLPATRESAEQGYKALFDKFVGKLKRLRHRGENIELWFEHFKSLMMFYSSSIPSARAGHLVPDVSLYDHLKTTSALAVALYLFHRENNSLNSESVKDYDKKKFLIVNGDFYGIQDFIFTGYGDTRKYRSKILRGRSFAVSLLSELAADMVLRKMGLSCTSIILNAAGKFTILAPNTLKAMESLESVEQEINRWLFDRYYGETLIGFSYLEASPSQLVSGKFLKTWEQLTTEMEKKKLSRVDLDQYAGAIHGYLDGFNNNLSPPLCPICGKRPSCAEVEGDSYLKESQSACKVCRDHIFLGSNIVKKVKKDRLVVLEDAEEKAPRDSRLLEPVFGKYAVAFLDEEGERVKAGNILKEWQLSYTQEEDEDTEGIATVKLLKGYIPVFGEEDEKDKRIPSEYKSEEKKGDPKTLNSIACKAKNTTEDPDKFSGIEALGVLKADVDDLGKLMACGLGEDRRFTISRLATLSRQLHFFFALFLPHLLENETRFNDIYTVFAGGDDLFLIGPWNRIIDLSSTLRGKFSQYVCHNENVHFSTGISIHKTHTPIDAMAKSAESLLEQSKHKHREKNRITLFSETVPWEEMDDLIQIKEKFLNWWDKGWLSKAMAYRLNNLIEMAGKEEQIKNQSEVNLSYMACTKWRAMLSYTIGRNVAKGKEREERTRAVEEIHACLVEWISKYGSKLKIPLWSILYNMR